MSRTPGRTRNLSELWGRRVLCHKHEYHISGKTLGVKEVGSRTRIIARPGVAIQELFCAGAASARVVADVGVRAGDRGAAGRAGVVAAGAKVDIVDGPVHSRGPPIGIEARDGGPEDRAVPVAACSIDAQVGQLR